METVRYREEVLNVVLATILSERGIISVPEQIIKGIESPERSLPDIVVEFEGLTVIIEGKIENQQQVLRDATSRIEDGLVHIALAINYPSTLRTIEYRNLHKAISETEFSVAVVTENGKTEFSKVNIETLVELLRQAQENLIDQDIIKKYVAKINAVIKKMAHEILKYDGIFGRIADELNIINNQDNNGKRANLAVASIASLVIFNAVLFHQILSRNAKKVKDIYDIERNKDIQAQFINQWDIILKEINYYPIFNLSVELLAKITTSYEFEQILKSYIEVARDIEQNKSALRHDLMGRIYHILLEDAKYLGAYYTSLPAATMLLKTALNKKNWKIDWKEIETLKDLKIADFACGTGTLLIAAAEAIENNYLVQLNKHYEDTQIKELHRYLLEDIIHGYDVLTSALHLVASSLMIRSPEIAVDKLQLYTMPIGGNSNALGSLDFLFQNQVIAPIELFDIPKLPTEVSPEEDKETKVNLPQLDLCVMNPPFTRSVGGNLLFGQFSEEERARLQDQLQRKVRNDKGNISEFIDITAGLGSPFIMVGHKALKPGGRMALVLPHALLSGVAWGKSRKLFNRFYELEYVFVSHDPNAWNFSENTDLSETLIILRKKVGDKPSQCHTRFVSLLQNPDTIFEALSVASRLIDNKQIPDLTQKESQGALPLMMGSRKMGEALSIPWEVLRNQPNWLLPAAFAQNALTYIAWKLQNGVVQLPGEKSVQIPFCPLSELGNIGFDRRDVHDGFNITKNYSVYKAFWGRENESITRIQQNPNLYLDALTEPKRGRHLKKATDLWAKSGRLLIAERVRLNTLNLLSIYLSEPVLSNVWWVFRSNHDETIEKILAMWLNSTLGQILLLINREQTEGPWVSFKKPMLLSMPVINITDLSNEQLSTIMNDFNSISEETFRSLPDMALDETRARIDRLFEQVLGLPDLTPLRDMLSHEPIISLNPL